MPHRGCCSCGDRCALMRPLRSAACSLSSGTLSRLLSWSASTCASLGSNNALTSDQRAVLFVPRLGVIMLPPVPACCAVKSSMISAVAFSALKPCSLLNSFIDMSIAAFTPIGACTIKSLTAAFLSASIRNCCTSAACPARTIISMSWRRNCPLLGKLISPRINCRAACPKAMNNLYLSRLRNVSGVVYFTSLASCSDIVESGTTSSSSEG